jgi:hypothetical protein
MGRCWNFIGDIMSKHIDPYYCLNCNHKGNHEGIIQISTPCENCGSLLIVPIASLHLFEMESLSMSLPELLAQEQEYKGWRGKKHLKVVPNDAEIWTDELKKDNEDEET